MKIGFIGVGVVGAATLKLVKKAGHRGIKIYDPDKGHEDRVCGCEVVFISVPVPTNSDGKQDLSILEDAVDRCDFQSTIFIRSTILPGTIKHLSQVFDRRIFHLPEFLTERVADEDSKRLPIVVSRAGESVLSDVFPEKETIVLDTDLDCELLKYVHNSFCAMKVGFFNTVYGICKQSHVDYNKLVEAACNVTGFIEPTHTRVPGPDEKFGFGGKCLPKDLLAFTHWVETSHGSTFLRQVLNENFYNRFVSLF